MPFCYHAGRALWSANRGSASLPSPCHQAPLQPPASILQSFWSKVGRIALEWRSSAVQLAIWASVSASLVRPTWLGVSATLT